MLAAYFLLCSKRVVMFLSVSKSIYFSNVLLHFSDTKSTQYYGRKTSSQGTPAKTNGEKTPVLRVKFTDDNTTKKQVSSHGYKDINMV